MPRASVVLVALLVLLVVAPAGATPVLDDDAGSGADAPNAAVPSILVEPGVVYAGARAPQDPSDHYAFQGTAGAFVDVKYWGSVGQLNVLDANGTPLDARTPPATAAYALTAEYTGTLPATGLYYIRISYPTPDAYRFSFALNGAAPFPGVGPDAWGALGGSQGTLPQPTATTEAGEHVVVAVVDTGINPYHRFLAAPALVDDPATWLPGFPAGTPALHLRLDAPSYEAALAADAAAWQGVQRGRLYTFTGTRVVGAISFSEYGDALTPAGSTPILDEYGHGSHSAGLAAGANLPAPEGNVLVVMVEVSSGDFARGVAWAAAQPWVDAVSLSAGALANAPVSGSMPDASRAVVASGKPFFVAAGNGFSDTGLVPDHCSTYTSGYTGPAWATRVGAADPENGNPTFWHCVPVEVVAKTNVPSTDMGSLSEASSASGTSAATPNAAGAFANLLLAAKRAGSAADRFDVLQHLYNASAPAAPAVGLNNEPSLAPTAFFDQGYGLVDGAALERAKATLGGMPTPRPELDAWWKADHALRQALWGAGPIAQDDAGSGRDAGADATGAVPVATGVALHGFLDGVQDASDWYAFHAQAGQVLHARAQGVVGCFRLHDPQGAEVAVACTESWFLPATLDVALNQTGTWYLEYSYFDAHGYDFGLGLDAPAPKLPFPQGLGP